MVIRDLYLVCVTLLPPKADPPLVVHSDAVPSSPPPRELFQTIPGRHPQVLDTFRRIKQQQLSMSAPLHLRRELSRPFTREHLFCLGIAKTPDHVL
jgi:hypothetical protein